MDALAGWARSARRSTSRDRGVAFFLTTHRLDEAERLCDRVAILNTTLRMIGRPADLRDRLFTKTLLVRGAGPLDGPDAVFTGGAAVAAGGRPAPWDCLPGRCLPRDSDPA